MLSPQQPVDDFPRHRQREEARLGRRVQEPDEPDHGVQEARVKWAHVDGPRDPLHQFRALNVHLPCLAIYLLVGHQLHCCASRSICW